MVNSRKLFLSMFFVMSFLFSANVFVSATLAAPLKAPAATLGARPSIAGLTAAFRSSISPASKPLTLSSNLKQLVAVTNTSTTLPSMSSTGGNVTVSDSALTAALQRLLARPDIAAQLRGPQGPAGPAGSSSFVTSSPSPSPNPVRYLPVGITYPDSSHNFSGGIYSNIANLGSNNFTANTANVTDITVAGTSTTKNLSVTGNSTIAGNLAVTGAITGAVAGSLNPNLTLGSVTFQGASGLAEDHANFFYDATNHRLGLGTITPAKTLDVVGTGSFTGALTAASLNGNTITAGTGTLTLGAGSTLATSATNSITLNSTGPTSVTLPTSGTLYGTATGSITSAQLLGSLTDETGSGLAVFGTSPTIATPTITTSATVPLLIGGTTTTSPLTLRSTSGAGTTGADIIFQTGTNGATEAMRILNSGNVGIGTNNPLSKFNVVDTVGTSPRGILSTQISSDTNGARVGFAKARGTPGAETAVLSGDTLGRMMFRGYDGTNYLEMASIEVGASGTVASTRVPTFLAFSTATDAAPSVLTERMRIDNAGFVGIGTPSPASTLSIQGAAAQVANLFNVATSTPATVFSVGSTGNVTSTPTVASTTAFTVNNASSQAILNIDNNAPLVTDNVLTVSSPADLSLFAVNGNGTVSMTPATNATVGTLVTANGNIMIGDDTLTGATDGRIWLFSNGTLFRFNSTGNTADYSEFFYQLGETTPEVGTIMTVDNSAPSPIADAGLAKVAAISYDNNILGVVTNRGTSYNNPSDDRQYGGHYVNVGMLGHIPVKFSNENGEVRTGDFLTSSATLPGFAMKATKSGQVIGTALQDSVSTSPTVLTLVKPSFQNIDGTVTTVSSSANTLLGMPSSLSSLEVSGHIAVGQDTAGTATVKTGESQASVTFATSYSSVPKIVVTAQSLPDFFYGVTDKTTSGFSIKMSKNAEADTSFDWVALGQSGSTAQLGSGSILGNTGLSNNSTSQVLSGSTIGSVTTSTTTGTTSTTTTGSGSTTGTATDSTTTTGTGTGSTTTTGASTGSTATDTTATGSGTGTTTTGGATTSTTTTGSTATTGTDTSSTGSTTGTSTTATPAQ